MVHLNKLFVTGSNPRAHEMTYGLEQRMKLANIATKLPNA